MLLFVLAVAVAEATGASFSPIGVLDNSPPAGVAQSWVSAISPDGTWAVGYSHGPNSGGTATIKQPVVWSQATGLVQLPNPITTGFFARGVAIRPENGQIALSGSPDSGNIQMYTYQAPLTDVAGGSWAATSYGTTSVMGAQTKQFNASRLQSGSGSAESWWTAGQNTGVLPNPALRYGMDGAVTAEYLHTTSATNRHSFGYSVSGNGLVAGWVRTAANTNMRAALLNNGAVPAGIGQTLIPGGSGNVSEAFGISVDGNVLCGYDQGTVTQAFVWTQGGASMTLLGMLAGDTSSQAYVVNNAEMVGGFSLGSERSAVIWDTTGVWDTSGQPKKVWDLLAAAGVDLSADWQNLTRVTSMSDDGMTLAGTGTWIDGTARGWIATIPEPASLLMLAVCGLTLLRRRAG